MKKLMIAAVLMMFVGAAQAERWSAAGILTTKIKGVPAKTEFFELDGFDSYELCWATVKKYSHTNEYIGEGGTNDKVPEVQWNYDGDCFLKAK